MRDSFLVLLFAIAGCDQTTDTPASRTTDAAAVDCSAGGGLTPYCGFRNPEDLALMPDRQALLVSEMGEFRSDEPSQLVIFDLATRVPGEIPIDWSPPENRWGSAGCPEPVAEAFSPHGIDLITRSDGTHQLLVVNHGGREAVEFFELQAGTAGWQLQWRGCALPPDDPFINDVAGLADGGFLVTHMWNKSTPFDEVVEKLTSGVNTGWVWEWQADSGFSKVPGSDELMPNGIAVSADNTKIFVNIYMGNKTIKIDRATGNREGEIAVQQPDNITMDSEGTLWIASHQHDPVNQNCTEVKSGPCLLPFEILRADANTMRAEVVLSQDGPPMGFTTVALRVDDEIFMGSAHGDRVVSYTIPD
jgi:hypothetical protein